MRLPPRLLYRLFPLAGRTSQWVSHRFAPGGRLLLGLLVSGALFGIDFRQTLGYQVASLAFALLLTAFVLSLRWRPPLSARRVLPELVTAELPLSYFIEITNAGSRVERDLVLQDRLETPRISYADFQRRRQGSRSRPTNWFDRAVGFPRWLDMRRRDRGAWLEAVAVPAIAPGATVRVRVDSKAERRGWLRFREIELLKPDPLGLYRARLRLRARDTLLSLPRRYPLPRVQMSSERRYQKGGVSLAHAVGDSQEFASLRDYRPGDPRRHIHWRSFAKTGRLIVKEYQDEYFDRHALVIDTHVPAAEEELFESMISVAASVAGGERARDSILDVIFLGTEVVQLSAGRGLGDASHALTYLAEASPSAHGRFSDLAAVLRARASQLASVILVLPSDDDAERASLLEELAAAGIPCLSLLVTLNDVATLPRTSGSHHAYTIRSANLAEDLARVQPP